jgi:site-specific DNA recombinase
MEAIQGYCKKHDLTLVGMYSDEANTGYNDKRDNFQRMIAAAENNEFDCIVIYDISRMSRNVKDWFSARDRLRRAGVKLFSCEDRLSEPDDPSSFLSEGMKIMMSQHFVMETRRKTIAGQGVKAKKGIFLGGTPPLGYDVEGGKYAINYYEAEIVRLIFRLYVVGHGYKYIVESLREKGYKSKYGGDIGSNAIKSILENERYIGVYTWNKKRTKYYGEWAGGADNPDCVRIEDDIPAIIDRATWEGAKKRMSGNIKGNNRQRREYLLSGLIRCEKCGAAFHGVTRTSGKGYKTPYYICSAKHNKKSCDAQNINGNELETLVVAILKRELLNPEFIERTADKIIEIASSASEDKTEKTNSINKELVDVTTKANNLLNALMTGLDSEMAREKLKELENQKQALNETLRTLDRATDKEIDRTALIAELSKDADVLMSEDGATREIIQKYVSQIILSDTTVEITGMSDKYVSNDTCGGRI